MTPDVIVKHLRKYYKAKTDMATLFTTGKTRMIRAVDDVSFEMAGGEILGLVGESGSGKSTVARMLAHLESPDDGEIWIDSRRISELRGGDLKRFYRHIQMVFQDPYESINPRFRVYDTVVEPVKVQNLAKGKERQHCVVQALQKAGLTKIEEYLYKFPHELSGGERQRLSIARALVVEPRVLIADEPVSMLDVSIKAGILNLLKRLSRELGMTILYVSHDLSTVKYLCDRVIIMYLGKFMEVGPADAVIDDPRHPYAQALQAAIPVPDPAYKRPRRLSGNIYEKALLNIEGCLYHPECPHVMDSCRETLPALRQLPGNRLVACHLY